MSGVTVVRSDGRLVAVKRGDPSRLRHEAAVLRHLDHPGLVAFLSLSDIEPVELRTVFVGPDSWHRQPPNGDRAIVAGLAAVAATIADLHDVDATHGSITPAHVLPSADGRPILCSLGLSGPADADGRAADLRGLGALVDHCRTDLDGALGRRLQALAARCRDFTLDAHALARELDALEPSSSARRGMPRRVIALPTAALVVLVGIGWAFVPDTGDDEAVAPAPSPAPTTTAAIVTTTTTPAPSTTAPAPPTTTTTLAPTPDGLPPLELVHDGRRYQLGRSSDVAVVGDWNCDGTDTPALLRADASLVAVFDAWPAPDARLEPAHVVTVTGTALDREEHDECDLLRVRTPSGSELVVLPTTP